MTGSFTCALAAVAASILPAAAGDDPDLAPHRAVYDLSLADGRAQMNEAATAMSGRMVFEFTGAVCEGYTVNFRFVVEATDADGRTTVTDLRTSSFEGGAGESFEFLSQTYSNQDLTSEVKGSANRAAETTTVKLLKPTEREMSFDGAPIFPTDHLKRIIGAAETGDTVMEQLVFDGSESGDTVYRSTAVVGAARSQPPGPEELKIGDLRRWPVSVAYFDTAASGDQIPEYSISFDLWENGVSTDLTMDYGDFALTGRLVGYEALPVTDCAKR
ncbi:MAG TPA: cell envelope integrity EipB family protein [Methylomirabilota bacterium]|nr:cell envelope integrity EipB family protein [Methylomirabilota bacterium]